jgi:hypothetical protein
MMQLETVVSDPLSRRRLKNTYPKELVLHESLQSSQRKFRTWFKQGMERRVLDVYYLRVIFSSRPATFPSR